jgi:hypothetical protein
MTTDPARTECTLDSDPRLIAAVGAVILHAAWHAGFPDPEQEKLAAALVQTCRELFPARDAKQESYSVNKLVTQDFPDRVEVTIESSGEAPPAAGTSVPTNGAASKASERIRKSLPRGLAGRVSSEMRDGCLRLTLLKQAGGAKTHPRRLTPHA